MTKPKEEWRDLALLISILFLFIITPMIAVLRHGIVIMNVRGRRPCRRLLRAE